MVRKFRETTAAEYQALFERVEEAFDPEDMTRDRLIDWLKNDTLADMFVVTRELYDNIESTDNTAELRELKKEARILKVHKFKIIKKINTKIEEIETMERERIIAESITNVEDFAQSRRIELSESVLGKLETWSDGTKRFVIREEGRLKAWKKF